jgi:hypothetical protein
MKLLLSGRWPPLRPLPVFKLETEEFRASIDFDKLRGEWVCRKASQLSNKVQELRGSLHEIIRALPPAQARASAEGASHDLEKELEPDQEPEKDATRRLQSLQEWKEKHESGALYSRLQDYLSESQQQDVADTLRLTLTARQLQCNAKNIAYVFDALSKAGGRLATLIELAQRNQARQQGTSMPAKALAAVAAATQHLASNFPEEPTWSVLPTHHQSCASEQNAFAAPLSSTIASRYSAMSDHRAESYPDESLDEIPNESLHGPPDAFPEEVLEDVLEDTPQEAQPTYLATLQERMYPHASVAAFAPSVRTGKFDSPAAHLESSSSRAYVLEISGFQVIALVLFALLSLAVGLAVGRGPLAKRLQAAQESMPGFDATSSQPPTRPSEVTSPISSPPQPNTAGPDASVPSAVSTPAANPSATNPAAPPAAEYNDSTSLVAGNSPPPPNPQPTASPKTPTMIDPPRTPSPNPAPGRLPAMPVVAPRLSSLPSTMLVSGPGDGTKPFRLTLPEKSIAASSSFAMTSQLSVLVSPDAGSAHKPARLQAGQLLSFVWPRYPRPGDRHASAGHLSAETVKLRITVGNLGQVLDVKHLSGSRSLFPAASAAIRQWRYKPTLLNSKPVQAQHDVTIEFRPPQHSAYVPARHPFSN